MDGNVMIYKQLQTDASQGGKGLGAVGGLQWYTMNNFIHHKSGSKWIQR